MSIKIGSTKIGQAAVKGDIGIQGADGLSAYQIAINNGFVGTEVEWLASLQGADGVGAATIITEATDNLNNGDNWIFGDTPDYLADAYIVLQTNGSRYITMYDDWGLQSFDSASRPQIVEYNASNAVVRTQTTEDGAYAVADKTKWKRWELDATTTYVHVLIPDNSSFYTGTLTRSNLQSKMRITMGAYWTTETSPLRVKSVNGVEIPQRERHPLFGKTIVVFGDSIMDKGGTIGSRSSVTQNWQRELELTVFNHAVGSADLCDNEDTTGVINCAAVTVNPENVVSNQIGCFISKGIIPDIVVLTGGTNDANDGKSNGDLSVAKANYLTPENQDKKTFYGILFWAVKKMRDLNPYVKIHIMGAIDAVETTSGITFNNGLLQIRAAMQTTAQTLSCNYFSAQYFLPIVDGYGGVDTFQTNNYYYDYLHPTVLGKEEVLAPKILGEIIKGGY